MLLLIVLTLWKVVEDINNAHNINLRKFLNKKKGYRKKNYIAKLYIYLIIIVHPRF